VAAHRVLDLLGGVGARGHAALAGGQQHHAPGLADRECRPDVRAEEQLLDRHGVRGVGIDQLEYATVDRRQSALEPALRVGLDDAVAKCAQT
jgi:hypothetical protein